MGVESPGSSLKCLVLLMLGFLILFGVFLRQHVMLVLLQWCVIELNSQSESDFQMPTPFVLYKE